MSLATLVRTAREARGWSISEVARRAEVDRGFVSRMEAGERTGSLETVVAVARVLDIDLNALKAATDPVTEPDLHGFPSDESVPDPY